jgi:predicted transcriptional regulator
MDKMNYAKELVRRGWTQERIAAAVGCRQSAVSRWVKGIRTPGGVNMLKLKEVYDGIDIRCAGS